jgi:hypothetical protein
MEEILRYSCVEVSDPMKLWKNLKYSCVEKSDPMKLWNNFKKLFNTNYTSPINCLEMELCIVKLGDFDDVEDYLPLLKIM